MDKNKLIQTVSMLIIVVSVLVSGYILIGSNKETVNQDQNTDDFAPIVNGKQIIKMTVYAGNYSPEYFKVRSGIPVRWEITSSGQAGCGSGLIIAKDLVDGGQTYLNPDAGQVTVAEFTAPNPGVYRFNCSMNMIRGKIEVTN
ncbi:MAG: hypothetical protein EXS48_01610 [Candidatus Staskawiczbacteria bacterium]|nr:hypothetical protein [Candidatus Staskawiczbacteria bacterium]